MKTFLLFCFLFFYSLVNAQTTPQADRLLFSYDGAGNQYNRKLCINCDYSRVSNEVIKEILDLKEEDLLQFSPEDIISYYPNPVKEELYLKWELINTNALSKIEIYSFAGQLVKSFTKLEKDNSKIISFQEYPSGTYLVHLFYINGETKPITIIKQ